VSFTCHNIGKIYNLNQPGEIEALRDVSLTIEEHEFVCLVGPSGCGKTTLLKIIAGLLEASSGLITFTSGKQIQTVMVFQDQGLFPWMKVHENILIGLDNQNGDPGIKYKQVNEFINRFGLKGFANHYPHELSGGMRQRVALARAFISDAQIYLMDEPFAALDAQIKLILQQELLVIWRQLRKTVIYVTHDIEEAVRMADRIFVMTGRPGSVREEITIPIQRPRAFTDRKEPEVSEIKWHIWKMLEDEVRRELMPE